MTSKRVLTGISMLFVLATLIASESSVAAPAYTIGGTVSGLNGSVVLQNNGGNNLTVSANGSFTFSTALKKRATYTVAVLTQPVGQTCSVSNGSGTVSAANVTTVLVFCANNSYTVGGTVSGLNGSVVLRNNGGDNLTVSASGSFTFTTPIAYGSTYAVTVFTQPAGQRCTVTNGNGVVGGANIMNVAVQCVGPPVLTLTPQAIKTFHFTWADVTGETEYRLLENPDGVSGFTLIATIAANTTSHDLAVSLPKRINARYILQACHTSDCADSATVSVSGTLAAAIGYAKASNTGVLDFFGTSVALSGDGNTLAVGAYMEDSAATGIGGNQADNTAVDSGAVYVFTRNGTTWSQQAYVKASNTGAVDFFGYSLALSSDGNTLAVGAVLEDSAANGIGGDQTSNVAVDSGAVYVFTRSGTTWSQQAYVKELATGSVDHFGIRLALSSDGNTLAVGAYGEDSAATGTNGGFNSGTAVDSGAVYVFTRSGTTWSQQATYIKASNTESGDNFGSSLVLSSDGNTLAVGAPGEDSAATGVGGNQVDNTALSSGAVYVFTRSGTAWSQQAYVKASNTGVGDLFGSSLALSSDGDTLAVGAYQEGSAATGIGGDQADNTAGGSGAVYVFTRSGTAWSQQAYVKASNTGAGDAFGRPLALSSDGNTLAVGAIYEASATTGIGGDQTGNTAGASGAVYLY
jgi:trimeric autotransporter adhesin